MSRNASFTCIQIILTEEFDEGLMVLRRLLGWSMIDMTYSSMYKTAKGAKRFDGKQLVDVPHFDDLPQQVSEGFPRGVLR